MTIPAQTTDESSIAAVPVVTGGLGTPPVRSATPVPVVAVVAHARIPAPIAAAGPDAAERFAEFFAASIRNRHTRKAYHTAVGAFFAWGATQSLHHVAAIRPLHVAAYLEHLGSQLAVPSVKQHLAALRALFDYLVTGQIILTNPAASVKGPSYALKKGKTPVLNADEAQQLLAAIDTTHLVGLRDRALIGIMLYAFARVGAVVGLNVGDYYSQGRRGWLRLHEKGGHEHTIPCHHKLEGFLDAYVSAAGIGTQMPEPLLRSAHGRARRLTAQRLHTNDALRIVKRTAVRAGVNPLISPHSFRATGLTNYLQNGGTLEVAQRMANHSSSRTTQLYDRRDETLTLTEIERVAI
jgi:site-specific recombinase XerD